MKHIKYIRKKAGFRTAEEGATALNISLSMMRKLDCGDKRPSIDLAFVMTQVFNCSLEDIFLPYNSTQSVVR